MRARGALQGRRSPAEKGLKLPFLAVKASTNSLAVLWACSRCAWERYAARPDTALNLARTPLGARPQDRKYVVIQDSALAHRPEPLIAPHCAVRDGSSRARGYTYNGHTKGLQCPCEVRTVTLRKGPDVTERMDRRFGQEPLGTLPPKLSEAEALLVGWNGAVWCR